MSERKIVVSFHLFAVILLRHNAIISFASMMQQIIDTGYWCKCLYVFLSVV